MDLDTVGYIVWGSACLVAFVTLLYARRHHCGFVCRSFLWYLLAQAIASALWLSRNDSSWMEWLFWQVLLLAGCAYVAMGVAVTATVFTTQQDGDQLLRKIRRGLGLGLGLAVIASIVLLSLQRAGKTNILAFVVFVYYFPAAILALVGVITVWWSEWPSAREEESTCCFMSSVMIRRLSVVAASVGMVDYLIPALEYIGLPVWESSFLTRLLDSIVYLPGIVPWIIWMDRTRCTQEEAGILPNSASRIS